MYYYFLYGYAAYRAYQVYHFYHVIEYLIDIGKGVHSVYRWVRPIKSLDPPPYSLDYELEDMNSSTDSWAIPYQAYLDWVLIQEEDCSALQQEYLSIVKENHSKT